MISCFLVISLATLGSGAGNALAQLGLMPEGHVFALEKPRNNSTVYGIVEVKGYILDPRGVSNITLLVDGAPVHEADMNQPRTDVRNKYPGYYGGEFPYDSGNTPGDPGFRSSFLASSYASGLHTVAIRVDYADTELYEGYPPFEDLGEVTVYVNNLINQPPVGGLDNPRDVEVYGWEDTISGAYPVVGWALDDQAIRTTIAADGTVRADIDVMVDNRVVGQVVWGLPRPDVANAYPDVVGSINSGFQLNVDTARLYNGRHRISVRAWDTQGKSRVIGRREIWVDNHYATLKPFGRIDWPMPNGWFYSSMCGVPPPPPVSPPPPEFDTEDHIDWVSGWVIDQNDQDRFEGVKYVEVLLDGVLLKSSTIDCDYDPDHFEMNVDCYGYERPDILRLYPQFYNDAKYSGFFFGIKAGDLLDRGIHRGLHYLSVRVGTLDPTRPAQIIDQIPIMLDCNEEMEEPSFGELEIPMHMEDVKGTILLEGWVIDLNYVHRINVYVDGILDGTIQGYANPNFLFERPDVKDRYPWLPWPHSLLNGFRYWLDTSKYVDGIHQIVLETEDNWSFSNYWVQRPLVFNNHN